MALARSFIKAERQLHFGIIAPLLIGRKSSADEGPVHSPIGRRHAKQKREPNKKHNRTDKNKTSKEQQTKTKTSETLHATGGHIQ